MRTYVFPFSTNDLRRAAGPGKGTADLLGGKGAGLVTMTRLGLPVPPGFIVSTHACRRFMADGALPDGLEQQIDRQLAALEQFMHRRLGDADDPLLISVRSGGPVSMPGMMDTVLNVGLTDTTVRGLAAHSGSERFAADCHRRLIQMFGTTVLGISSRLFDEAIEDAKARAGTTEDIDLGAADLQRLVATFQAICDRSGRAFPADPREQLRLAVIAVFRSWNSERAVIYRRAHRIPDDLGTAVIIQAMVYGNRGPASGSGVCFTRDPGSGEPRPYGDYLSTAQGEDVVAGNRTPVGLSQLAVLDPDSYDRLLGVMRTLEQHYRDMCDIEFTIEEGRLWILQTRVGKRTAEAAFRIATDMADEGVIDRDVALTRVTGDQLAQLMFPHFDISDQHVPIATGIPASPGAAVGRAVFDRATAVAWAARGDRVILVRRETNAEDLAGMIAAVGILTSRGGKTSHAAVVARGLGRTCVCGVEAMTVDPDARTAEFADHTIIHEGDLISVDGRSGCVYLGEVPVTDSAVARRLEGQSTVADTADDSVLTVLNHADDVRRLAVFANADTPTDAARACRLGAEAIGLCRTEHMFLGDRRELVERLITAEHDDEREAALAALQTLQRQDFADMFVATQGRPVTIRLLDPPLHEFLPDLTELSVRVAIEDRDGYPDPAHHHLLAAVQRLHEDNPMLGLRGVRLGLAVPGLYPMQARAIAEAAASEIVSGRPARPEIMVPLVASAKELALVRAELEQVIHEVRAASGVPLTIPIGTMIELPRAVVTADAIADVADFFSLGTNDLTQTTWGFSRDDVEGAFFPVYLERGIFDVSVFESLDVAGVGTLVRLAVEGGRSARPRLQIGVCGEHGGDPASIEFFHRVGLDYVSCSPFRIPIARLEAGRAAVRARLRDEESSDLPAA